LEIRVWRVGFRGFAEPQGQNVWSGLCAAKTGKNARAAAPKAVQGRVAARSVLVCSSAKFRDAWCFPIVPPSVSRLCNVSGFDFLSAKGRRQSHEQLLEARNSCLGWQAKHAHRLCPPQRVRGSAQFNLDIDWPVAGARGQRHDVGTFCTIRLGGCYVNDFVDEGRIKRLGAGRARPGGAFGSVRKWGAQWTAAGWCLLELLPEGGWLTGRKVTL